MTTTRYKIIVSVAIALLVVFILLGNSFTFQLPLFLHSYGFLLFSFIGLLVSGYVFVFTARRYEQLPVKSSAEALEFVFSNRHPEDRTYTISLWVVRVFLILFAVSISAVVSFNSF